MSGPTKPSEILGAFEPSAQVAAGLVMWGLAEQLASMTEEQISAFGVVVAGQASGWMPPGEVRHDLTRAEVDRLAHVLLDRLQSAAMWEQQLEGEEDV